MKLTPRQRLLVDALLDVYRQGAFPMADPDTGEVAFYTAPRRGIIPLHPPEAFHIPRSLRRRLNAGFFDIRADAAFERVMRRCAAPRKDDPKSWIDETLIQWGMTMHRAGHAHSVEAWRREPESGEDHLVGGIYGMNLGGAFFAESMFSRPRPRLADGRRHPLDGTDASKVCLVRLVEHLRRRGYTLLDAQFSNPHLERFGCVEISHEWYMRLLEDAVDRPVAWGVFEAGGRSE